MPALENSALFIGKTYGKLTVLSDLGTVKNSRRVEAKCECGNIKGYRLSDLKSGMSTNCGCVRKMLLRIKNTTHGESRTKLYRTWKGMIERCTYTKHFAYNRYGGRGIKVCPEWTENFLIFKDWAMSSGYMQGKEIDRINNDGDYYPENCRLVGRKENCRNKTGNHLMTMDGVTQCISAWAEQYNTTPDLLYHRINNMKWELKRALTTKRNYRVYAD